MPLTRVSGADDRMIPLYSVFTIAHSVLDLGNSFLRSRGQWCRTPFLQLAKSGMVNPAARPSEWALAWQATFACRSFMRGWAEADEMTDDARQGVSANTGRSGPAGLGTS
jgi:hypothetical protein